MGNQHSRIPTLSRADLCVSKVFLLETTVIGLYFAVDNTRLIFVEIFMVAQKILSISGRV